MYVKARQNHTLTRVARALEAVPNNYMSKQTTASAQRGTRLALVRLARANAASTAGARCQPVGCSTSSPRVWLCLQIQLTFQLLTVFMSSGWLQQDALEYSCDVHTRRVWHFVGGSRASHVAAARQSGSRNGSSISQLTSCAYTHP